MGRSLYFVINVILNLDENIIWVIIGYNVGVVNNILCFNLWLLWKKIKNKFVLIYNVDCFGICVKFGMVGLGWDVWWVLVCFWF